MQISLGNGGVDTAQHFYNLALEDVKKMVEDWACPEHGAFIDRILDFIDNQKQ